MAKRKKSESRNKSQKEFRKWNSKQGNGHPAYIYAKYGNKYRFIGITHAKITNGIKNIPLEQNPNPNDKKSAYIRPTPNEADRSTFGKRLKNWFFGERDKAKVEKMIEDDKQKKKGQRPET